MKPIIVLFFLISFFCQSLYGQVERLGELGYRLVKTVKDTDFDYERLEHYFSDKGRLNAAETDVQAIFAAKDSEYALDFALHFFLGDVVSDVDDNGGLAYYPVGKDKQNMLVLKVMDSRVIVDGFLFPYANEDLPLSESLFRVRTKGLQLKTRFSLDELNLRNLYDKQLRAAGGTVFVRKDIFWPEADAIKGLAVRYNLVKKVVDADFNYELLDDFDRSVSALRNQGKKELEPFEPVAGDFIYYQFMADYIMGERVFPAHVEERDSFDSKMKTYEAPDVYVDPLVVHTDVLILKTDLSGVILDGYEYPPDMGETPASGNLRRVEREGVRLRDGMIVTELGLKELFPFHELIDRDRTVSLFPK